MGKSRIIFIGIIFSFLLTTVAVCGQQTDDAEKYLIEGAGFANNSYFDRALESYEKALGVDPGNLTAIAGIKRLIKKQADFYLEVGKLFEKKGEKEKAVEYYKKAVETNPNNIEAKDALSKPPEEAPTALSQRFQQIIGFFAELWNGFVKLFLVVIAIFVLFFVIPKKWWERRKKKTTIEPFENFSVEKNRGVDQGKMVSQLITEKLHKTNHRVFAPKITERKPLLPPEAPKELKIISELIDWFFPPNITKVTGRYQKSKSKGIGTTIQLINVKTKKIEHVETLWEEDYANAKTKGNESEQSDWEPLAEAIAYWILFSESEDKPNDFQSFYDVQKGDQLFSRGEEEFDNALKCYKKAIKSEVDYAKAYHNIGYVYEIQKKYAKAIGYYNRAIEIGYKNIYLTYFNLGNVYRYRYYEEKKGEHLESSSNCFERSIECIPADDPNKHFKKRRANVAKACTYLLRGEKLKKTACLYWAMLLLRRYIIIKKEELWIKCKKAIKLPSIRKKTIKGKGPSILYLLANYYSLASELSAPDTPKKTKYVDKSIEYLRDAIRLEKFLRIVAKGDQDFKYIEQEYLEEFKKLTQE